MFKTPLQDTAPVGVSGQVVDIASEVIDDIQPLRRHPFNELLDDLIMAHMIR